MIWPGLESVDTVDTPSIFKTFHQIPRKNHRVSHHFWLFHSILHWGWWFMALAESHILQLCLVVTRRPARSGPAKVEVVEFLGNWGLVQVKIASCWYIIHKLYNQWYLSHNQWYLSHNQWYISHNQWYLSHNQWY